MSSRAEQLPGDTLTGMTTERCRDPRPLTDSDYEELVVLWRRIKALQTLRDAALPEDHEGSWIRGAAELALDEAYQRLDALYRETHPTLPGMEPRRR